MELGVHRISSSAGRTQAMSERRLTPEEVIIEMSYDELQELLEDLSMESTLAAAVQMKRLVRQCGQFEDAVEALGGPPSMRDAA
jgi:hypothetical protein